MSRFSKHYSIGAFVMMMIVLTGCTDAIVGPDHTGATDNRVVEMADAAPLHHTNPFEAVESDDGPAGRLVYRNSIIFLPPDTTGGGGGGGAPTSRLVYRNSIIFLPPDSTGGPAPSGGGSGS